MNDGGPYDHVYSKFVQEKDRAQGYEFQQGPTGSVAPPVVTFGQKLTWWTWDRWRRMKRIRSERDRRVQEILEVKTPRTPDGR
jgi:hypothetical protein